LIEKLPGNAKDSDYKQLQEQLAQAAADIIGLAWAHKYLSLLFPDKLDDFHNQEWQRFNLIKLLQLPPEGDGLYLAAGRFVSLAHHFGWPMNHLTNALNERNGRPAHYWRIGTRIGDGESIWPTMRDGGYAAIGWSKLGDLSVLGSADDLKELIRKKLEMEYPNDAGTLSRKAGEIRNFVQRIVEGDVVVAADGQTVLGLGRVLGDSQYRYEDNAPKGAPHRRSVEWISTAEWKLPQPDEGKLTTVFQLRKYGTNLVDIERRLLNGNPSPTPKSVPMAASRLHRLEGVPGQIQAILERKGQAILFGPPGTGKTFWARKTGFDLSAVHTFGRLFNELSAEEKAEVEGTTAHPGLVRSCTFHPAYGYEDFFEGFRPHSNQAGNLIYELRDGIFKKLCADARQRSDRKFVLIVDEINRGDIPRIFGELLTLLEMDKRGLNITLPVSQESFSVPTNVTVIGTMNTADRSIALLDTALRRRFGFLELMPDTSVFGSASVEGSIPLGPWLSALNDRIRGHLGNDGRNLQIGHAYLLEANKPVTDFSRFVRILAEDIIPLLEEYCYEDYSILTQILGKGLVDEPKQCICKELFVPSRREDLVQALLSPSPEILTSPDAIPPGFELDESEESEQESA
jgi:5-methylcytosine-specific restriction protein B